MAVCTFLSETKLLGKSFFKFLFNVGKSIKYICTLKSVENQKKMQFDNHKHEFWTYEMRKQVESVSDHLFSKIVPNFCWTGSMLIVIYHVQINFWVSK